MIWMESRRRKWRGRLILFFFTSILLFLFFYALSSSSTSTKEFGWLEVRRSSSRDSYAQVATVRRRLLRAGGVPGSYPPRCMAKCGTCNPCFPVHVPVPPGMPVITEYYPEAWRCKCGDRLFMP